MRVDIAGTWRGTLADHPALRLRSSILSLVDCRLVDINTSSEYVEFFDNEYNTVANTYLGGAMQQVTSGLAETDPATCSSRCHRRNASASLTPFAPFADNTTTNYGTCAFLPTALVRARR